LRSPGWLAHPASKRTLGKESPGKNGFTILTRPLSNQFSLSQPIFGSEPRKFASWHQLSWMAGF
jgi:hypothetical protein